MKQNNIKQKQTNTFFLKCQFAAKHHFNKAEHLNYLVWLCCILSAMTIFIPDTTNYIVIGLPLLLDIVAFILEILFEKSVATGANLRNFFDANVLDINASQYSESDIREIKDIIEKTSAKHAVECNIQITHTGNDSPPGVLDWYEFSHDFSDEDVQYECQRQNCWWNEELSKRRLFCLSIAFLTLVFLIFVICKYFRISDALLRITFCSGVILKIVERIIQHYNCHKIFLKIQGACDLVEKSKSPENIQSLQKMIEKRREIPVLEVNGIHKKLAAKLSQHYKRIS